LISSTRLPERRRAPSASGAAPAPVTARPPARATRARRRARGAARAPASRAGRCPFFRRVPKRGFTPRERRVYAVVNLNALEPFAAGSVVDPDRLAEAGLIKKAERGLVKLLGDGELARGLTVKVHAVSASAKRKVEAAGGTVEVLPA